MNKHNSSTLGILDCTFRDGGYYTNWTFPKELVDDYLSAMAVLPIDVIELGFAGKGPSAGKFANVDNVLARELRFSSNTKIAVMLDAKDYLDLDEGLEAKLDRDLGRKHGDGIDIIRIAVNYRATHMCGCLIQVLLDRGYRVFLNPMQIDVADPRELRDCLEFIKKNKGLEAVYVADSLGSMRPDRVKDLVENFADELDVDIGYHAHDNSGLAITNALCAADSGSSWLDCTVAGMGRGAGNASTEQLLRVAAAPRYSKLAEDKLQQLVVEHFNPLKEKYGWGDNLFYQLGAANGLHPTFVQEVLSDQSLSDVQAFNWVKKIPINSNGFCRTILATAKEHALTGEVSMGAKLEEVA
ncbi:MAG: hypothetical protein JKY45_04860 [Emcibacter sp.]|nr:hypothetical protein [Emcibacter sp.]